MLIPKRWSPYSHFERKKKEKKKRKWKIYIYILEELSSHDLLRFFERRLSSRKEHSLFSLKLYTPTKVSSIIPYIKPDVPKSPSHDHPICYPNKIIHIFTDHPALLLEPPILPCLYYWPNCRQFASDICPERCKRMENKTNTLFYRKMILTKIYFPK